MNEYIRMRRHLETMTEDDFCSLLYQLGYDIIFPDEYSVVETLIETNGTRSLSPKTWKQDRIEELLAYSEHNKVEWKKLCCISAVEMDLAFNNRMTWRANVISMLSLAVAIAALMVSLLRG